MIASLIQCVDLTRLNNDDTSECLTQLCKQAIAGPPVAAVCCFPEFISTIKQGLQGTGIRCATVVNFPSGIAPTELVIADTIEAIHQGADEIDCVIPYQAFKKDANEGTITTFVAAIKAACQGKLLKVILETGALSDTEIAQASRASIQGGADFLKTSTGKSQTGATLHAVQIMLETADKLNASVGIKVSGGVRTLEAAIAYAELFTRFRGPNALRPEEFRLGASSLLDKLKAALSEASALPSHS